MTITLQAFDFFNKDEKEEITKINQLLETGEAINIEIDPASTASETLATLTRYYYQKKGFTFELYTFENKYREKRYIGVTIWKQTEETEVK